MLSVKFPMFRQCVMFINYFLKERLLDLCPLRLAVVHAGLVWCESSLRWELSSGDQMHWRPGRLDSFCSLLDLFFLAEDKESFHAHISEVCTGDLLIFCVIEGFLVLILVPRFHPTCSGPGGCPSPSWGGPRDRSCWRGRSLPGPLSPSRFRLGSAGASLAPDLGLFFSLSFSRRSSCRWFGLMDTWWGHSQRVF